MSDAKDPAIKLFGRTIPVPETTLPPAADKKTHRRSTPPPEPAAATSAPGGECLDSCFEEGERSPIEEEEERRHEKEQLGEKANETHQECDGPPPTSEGLTDLIPSSVVDQNPSSEGIAFKSYEQERCEKSASQEKTLKKPDKILPCPRCNSMETKFCYYNNYNVNQPRHFCKNCQRYWTAGGTMRNVPIGAGRRKNKNLASHCRHISVSEALQSARNDLSNGINHPSLQTNGTILAFGSDTPICESMASGLNLAEKTTRAAATQNGFRAPEEPIIPISCGSGKNGNDGVSIPATVDSKSKDVGGKTSMQESVMQNCNGFLPQELCFPGAPWSYSWNTFQWGSPIPPPTLASTGYPMPFFPAATYRGCTIPGNWNIPQPSHTSPANCTTTDSGPNSPTLGKHSRDEIPLIRRSPGDEEPTKDNSSEKSFWIPKTLRIDDPKDAAKSSIWATLGIKNHKPAEFSSGRGLFKAFGSKNEKKGAHAVETSPFLQANPAALSRSLNFQESS